MNTKEPCEGILARFKQFSLLGVVLLFVFRIVAAPDDPVERISQKDLKPTVDGIPGEQELNKEIVISPNVKFRARIEVTNKGNGTLEIANLKLHVVDSHNDGVFYEDGMLNIDFKDINSDGKRELLISGVVCFADDKGDKVIRREAVVFIYALQPNRTFKQVYRNTEMRLD